MGLDEGTKLTFKDIPQQLSTEFVKQGSKGFILLYLQKFFQPWL